MFFEIQVCHPLFHHSLEEKEDLSSAIQAVFPTTTEDAILLWNWVPIRINYSYDASVIMEDLLQMLMDLLKSDHGSERVFFGASTFRAEWLINWADGTLQIDANWQSVAGSYEDLLNSREKLVIKQDQFIYEWKAFLRKVIEAIEISGIRIKDEKDFTQLRRIEAAIPKFGRLYKSLERESAYVSGANDLNRL